jgi:hypothetical protein
MNDVACPEAGRCFANFGEYQSIDANSRWERRSITPPKEIMGAESGLRDHVVLECTGSSAPRPLLRPGGHWVLAHALLWQ